MWRNLETVYRKLNWLPSQFWICVCSGLTLMLFLAHCIKTFLVCNKWLLVLNLSCCCSHSNHLLSKKNAPITWGLLSVPFALPLPHKALSSQLLVSHFLLWLEYFSWLCIRQPLCSANPQPVSAMAWNRRLNLCLLAQHPELLMMSRRKPLGGGGGVAFQIWVTSTAQV